MINLFKKDLKLFFKDKRSVLLTFLLPIVLISLFAFAFGGVGGDNQPNPVKLLVSDLDNSVISKKIIKALDSLDGLTLIVSDLDKSKILVAKGKYAGVLVFQKGFETKLGTDNSLELIYDKVREMEIGMLQPVLIKTLMQFVGKQQINKQMSSFFDKSFPNMTKNMRNKIAHQVLNNETDNNSINVESTIKMTSITSKKKDTNIGLIQAVAGTAILMLLFSVAGLGTSILEEKENGTIKRLLFSPINGTTILYGKMLFAFFIALLQLSLMFIFAWLVFKLDIFTNIPALILMIIATSFAVSSFGIFLASISKTRKQSESLSTLIILIMSAVGGSMIPLFIMPAIMQKIAVLSLNYWGIQGFYDIFWRNLPLQNILPRIFVLLGIGFFMTLISVRLFKRNVLRLV